MSGANIYSQDSRRTEALASLIQAVMSECAQGHVKQDDVAAMLAGIKKYQSLTSRTELPELPAIWTRGHARLLYGKGEGAKSGQLPSLFIVPSMINKYTILDLLPEKSFVRWLMNKGHNVFILDWGLGKNNEDKADLNDMDTAIGEYLLEAARFACAENKHDICALGYCMGGTLLAALSALAPDLFASRIYLGTPWDFHAGNHALADQIMLGRPSAFQMIETQKRLPMAWIQSVFVRLDPQHTVQKYAKFNSFESNSDEGRLFVAVEDWLNDGGNLPAGIAKTCIQKWYVQNRPFKGEWIVCGKKIEPLQTSGKVLVIASSKDRLVPRQSSMALAKGTDSAVIDPGCGHIGMMVGRQAEARVWQPILEWMQPEL